MISISISIIILIGCLVVGMPIPFAFGGAFLWITYTLGFNPNTLLASRYTQINSTILLAIPLFVLAGRGRFQTRCAYSLQADPRLFVLGHIADGRSLRENVPQLGQTGLGVRLRQGHQQSAAGLGSYRMSCMARLTAPRTSTPAWA